MAKKTTTNIVEVWNWLINILEGGELNATEQAALIHVIAKINRSMWTPTKINPKLIAAAINKDPRTVKAAIDKFVKLEILTETEGAYFVGEFKHNQIPDASGGKFKFRASSGERRTAETSGRVDGAVDGRPNSDGDTVTEETQHSGRRRKIFEPDNPAQS